MALRTSNTVQETFISAICGESGTGKTSLADRFSSPYILNIEGGNNTKSPRHWTRSPSTMKEVNDAITDFVNEKHAFKTLVFDSVTQIERLRIADIVAKEGKNFVECCGGFGKAYEVLHQQMREFATVCQRIRDEKGFNVVWIFHAISKSIELPGMPAFERWKPALWQHKDGGLNNNLIFESLADNWFHLRLDYETLSDGSDTGSSVDGDIIRRKVGVQAPLTRKIGTQPTTTYFAKNRLELNGELPFTLDKPLALFNKEK